MATPNPKNVSHRIEIQLDAPGAGVLLAMGGQSAGYVFYGKDGKPAYHYNWFDG